MHMERLLFAIPVIVSGDIGDWSRTASQNDVELIFHTDFLAVCNAHHIDLQYKVYDQWIPYSQWEILAECDHDAITSFLQSPTEDVKGLTLSYNELSMQDNNAACLMVILDGNEGISDIIDDFMLKGEPLAVCNLEQYHIDVQDAYDDNDDPLNLDRLHLLELLPFTLPEEISALSHVSQALFYQGFIAPYQKNDELFVRGHYHSPHGYQEFDTIVSPLMRHSFWELLEQTPDAAIDNDLIFLH